PSSMHKTVEKILLHFDPEKKNIVATLKEINKVFSYISKKDMQKVANYFSLPLSEIYETASFYDLIKTEKTANLVIKVCSGTHCVLSDSNSIVREIENYFRIKAGDEFNPKVKLEIISCLGRCGEGPVVVINEKFFERVTKNSIHSILEGYL
ncbi:MAG: NAD(P)H-dependent oxidoreductase subunit E, partial [Candidatus Moraniibacteriota bacterium]